MRGAGGASDDRQRQGLGFAARLSLYYGAIFTVYGTQMPYLPVWLDWRGLSPAEISIISAAPLFVRLVATPSVAFLADRGGHHREMVIAMNWVALAVGLLLSAAHGFWPILLAWAVVSIAIHSVMPLTETVAMAGVRSRGLDYGRMRLWGSLTFIVASLGGGPVVDAFGPGAGLWLIVAGMVATVGAAHLLPRREAQGAANGGTALRRLHMSDVVQLATSRSIVWFLVASTAIQAAHATFYTFGTLHWRSQGISAWWIGALWAIAVLSEVVLFACSASVMRRLDAVSLLIVGALAAIVRWVAMAYDPHLVVLVPLQILHGLTFGATHLGAIHFMSKAVPEHQAGTAQALYATVSAGVGMAGAMLISGWLYAAHGGRTYLAMAVIAGVGLAAALALRRAWDGNVIAARA